MAAIQRNHEAHVVHHDHNRFLVFNSETEKTAAIALTVFASIAAYALIFSPGNLVVGSILLALALFSAALPVEAEAADRAAGEVLGAGERGRVAQPPPPGRQGVPPAVRERPLVIPRYDEREFRGPLPHPDMRIAHRGNHPQRHDWEERIELDSPVARPVSPGNRARVGEDDHGLLDPIEREDDSPFAGRVPIGYRARVGDDREVEAPRRHSIRPSLGERILGERQAAGPILDEREARPPMRIAVPPPAYPDDEPIYHRAPSPLHRQPAEVGIAHRLPPGARARPGEG